MNTFHWHVVDSQSFPLEVPGFTELAEAGAYSPSSVYTVADVNEIVAYAAAVGRIFLYVPTYPKAHFTLQF
jgi:hexosaminidase